MVLCSQTGYRVAQNVCGFQFLRFLQRSVKIRFRQKKKKKFRTFEKRAPGVKMSMDFRHQGTVSSIDG